MELSSTEVAILKYIAQRQCISIQELHNLYEELKQRKNIDMAAFYLYVIKLKQDRFIARRNDMLCISFLTDFEETTPPPPPETESAKAKKKVIA